MKAPCAHERTPCGASAACCWQCLPSSGPPLRAAETRTLPGLRRVRELFRPAFVRYVEVFRPTGSCSPPWRWRPGALLTPSGETAAPGPRAGTAAPGRGRDTAARSCTGGSSASSARSAGAVSPSARTRTSVTRGLVHAPRGAAFSPERRRPSLPPLAGRGSGSRCSAPARTGLPLSLRTMLRQERR